MGETIGKLERIARSRLRGLREARGWSLDELAARTNLSAATISRLETGKRSLSLDLVGLLCEALQTDLPSLLDTSSDEDVIIRPMATTAGGRTVWPLTRPGSDIVAQKIRLQPDANHGVLGVHPGHDWFFVLSGSVTLTLGDRQVDVRAGEAADFATMTPHGFAARKRPAELLVIFGRDGLNAHRDLVTSAQLRSLQPVASRTSR
jgi:transcriptional regulator with XRE-family HTH domain